MSKRKPRFCTSSFSAFRSLISTSQLTLPPIRNHRLTAIKPATKNNDISLGSDNDAPTSQNGDLHALPVWAKSGWSTRFLRTLYHAINASKSPLSDFKTDSTSALETVGLIVRHAYPMVKHKVTKNDIFFTLVSTENLYEIGLIMCIPPAGYQACK